MGGVAQNSPHAGNFSGSFVWDGGTQGQPHPGQGKPRKGQERNSFIQAHLHCEVLILPF
jgi:hypothetical protein